MVSSAVAQRWFLYGMGGGFGHLTRSVAFARALRRIAPQLHLHLVTNSQFAREDLLQSELGARATIHILDHRADKDHTCGQVRQLLAEVDPHLLAVDTFPRGLGGELANWIEGSGAVHVLTHRDLNPQYVDRYKLKEFVSANYDLVLSPGESGPLAAELANVKTAPWLIRRHDELAPFDMARRELHADHDQRPLVIVSRSGMRDESSFFEQVAARVRDSLGDRVQVRLIRPPGSPNSSRVESHEVWPLLPLIRGVDAIVGAAGYNTVYEARCSGTPLLAFPQTRLYDRQSHRLRSSETMTSIDDIISAIQTTLAEAEPCRQIAPFKNGADQAAKHCLRVAAKAAARTVPKLRQTLQPSAQEIR